MNLLADPRRPRGTAKKEEQRDAPIMKRKLVKNCFGFVHWINVVRVRRFILLSYRRKISVTFCCVNRQNLNYVLRTQPGVPVVFRLRIRGNVVRTHPGSPCYIRHGNKFAADAVLNPRSNFEETNTMRGK